MRYVLWAFHPSGRDESQTRKQPSPFGRLSTSGQWVEVCGIIGAEAYHWANRLVALGNHRLVEVEQVATPAMQVKEPALITTLVGNRRVEILAYDVLEITRDNGTTWHDYASIKDASEAQHAIGLVRHGMVGIPGKPFRIVRRGVNRGIILA